MNINSQMVSMSSRASCLPHCVLFTDQHHEWWLSHVQGNANGLIASGTACKKSIRHLMWKLRKHQEACKPKDGKFEMYLLHSPLPLQRQSLDQILRLLPVKRTQYILNLLRGEEFHNHHLYHFHSMCQISNFYSVQYGLDFNVDD